MSNTKIEENSREYLISICERSIVPESRWSNRDSSSAQRQLGECLVLLKAGCQYRVCDLPSDNLFITDDRIIWIEITLKGFSWFESGIVEVETYYLPTTKRLHESQGGDWY